MTIGQMIYGYWGAGIEPTVARVTGYTKTEAGDTYFRCQGNRNQQGPLPLR
jgi:hypothetical protein